MLIIKKRNIQKGFSLIELMVAVVILAIAVLGIYQAYNISFTGIADARDRTVATNYVRQAMEGIKNMDFDKIRTQSRSYITGTKYKYEREVIVQESTNLKKVTTKVYWRNRNGNKKMVENDMSVHFMQTSEGTATRIMLIANPHNVLTGGTSTITAVIKDAKGNTVTIWTGDISFSIDSANSTSSGTFSNKSGIIKGKVTIDFTAENTEGTVTIVASTSELSSDSIEMKVTVPKKPVKINLTANPTYMTADINSTSEITATIVDADGETAIKATNVITFSVSGPGTLSAITSIAPTNCIATITLTSNGTPGTITVTASATGLEPGVVKVFTDGQISLSASTVSVSVNETSEVTVTTKDVDGVPINYEGTINLIIDGSSTGFGTLPSSVTFDGSTSSIIVTFTATLEGTVNIIATDQAGILDEGSIELTIIPALAPDHIELTASPQNVPQGNTSTITATVYNFRGKIVLNYSGTITFTNTGVGTFSGSSSVSTTTGIADIELSSNVAGTATITVSSSDGLGYLPSGGVEVGFYGGADHITLTANPEYVKADGVSTSIITATVCDLININVSNYSGTITFTNTGVGTFSSSSSVGTTTGIAAIELSSNVAGIATITASDGTISSNNICEVEFYEEITLTLKDSVVYSSENKIITFNIKIVGPTLHLNSMEVAWESNSQLMEIGTKSPSTEPNYDTFSTSGNRHSPYTEPSIDKDLSPGVSTIRLTFNQNMISVFVEVIFYTDLGDFSIAF